MTDKVHVGPLTFDGEGNTDWIYSKLKGWASGPPMRGQTDERPVADGANGSAKNFRSARTLTLEGALRADTFEEAESDFWDAFASIQADGVPFPLSVENNNGTRTCIVSLDGVPDIEETGESPNVASISATFIAYDPIKYGPSRTVSTGLPTAGGGLEYPLHSPSGALYYGANGNLGRMTLVNNGTADVWPSFKITGGLTSGFFIQRLDTGDVIRYDRVVPLGTVVGLDSQTETVTVDGIPGGSTYLTRFEWFSVPRKSSIEVQLNAIGGSSGSPLLEGTVADGFW